MAEQFENPEVTKLKDETVSNPSERESIEIVAGKAAARAAKTEQKFDEENSNLFSK
jgi:hypothetical protein